MATSSTTEPLVGLNGLAYYIKRICTFFEGDKKTISFPNISQQLQGVLVKLAMENADFLLGDEFSDNVKSEATMLAAVFKTNSNVKLTHEICDGKLGLNVLTYKKTQVNTFKVPEPMRKPSIFNPASNLEPPPDGSITMTFKTSCLNAATGFVKNDSQLMLRFPEMVPAQADFVMDIILPGTKDRSENADVGFGYQSMYAPLWESMRVFNIKYDYKIGYDTSLVTKDGMKRVVFEKIPKCRKTKTINLERAKTPEIIIDLSDEDTLDASFASSSSAASLNESKPNNNTKKKNREDNQPKIKRQVEKLIRKLGLRMQRGQVLKGFIYDSLRRIAEFVLDDQKQSIVIPEMSQHQQFFLHNVQRLSNNPATYMLFTSECQKFLDDIKYCINIKNVRYQVKFAKGVLRHSDRGTLKNVLFEKISSKTQENIDGEKSVSLNSSLSTTRVRTDISAASHHSKKQPTQSNATKQPAQPNATKQQTQPNATKQPTQPSPTKQRTKLMATKTLPKAPRAVLKLYEQLCSEVFTVDFVEVTLQRILDFLYDQQQASLMFKNMSNDHLLFISHVETIARDEAWYSVFTERSRRLLTEINRCFKKNMLYQSRLVQKRKDIILEKVVTFAGEEFSEKRENDENKNILNTASDLSSDLYQVDKDLVSRLAALRDEVERSRGEHSVLYCLREVEKWLACPNEDRLKFSPVSATEALFIKHVPLLSSLPAARRGYSRTAQRLLQGIQRHAQTYTLDFDIVDDEENYGFWTVVIEKQLISEDGNNKTQHRARSLSEGRRSEAAPAAAARGGSTQRASRKEQLKAALELPVHSDKALRIMESMGWRGGALGLRGEGITEPIALPLDLVTRAGLGHVPPPKKQKPKKPEPKKPKPPKQETLPTGVQSLDSLTPDLIPPGILNKGLLKKCKTVVLNKDYHVAVLKNILEIMTTDIEEMHLMSSKSPTKVLGFLKHAVKSFNGRHRLVLDSDEQKKLVAKITHTFYECQDVMLNVEIRNKTDLFPRMGILNKVSLKLVLPTNKTTNEVISLIEDEQETTDTQETTNGQTSETTNDHNATITKDTTTDNQESTMIWYHEPTTDVLESKTTNDQLLTMRNKVSTTDNKELSTTLWYRKTQSTSGQHWYYPVKCKRQQHKTTTQEQKTTKNQISESKILALSTVNNRESKETDFEIHKKTTQNDQTTTDGRIEQSCCQETTTSETERYKINKHNHTKKVTKDSLKMHPCEAKKMKISNDHKQQETTHAQEVQQSTTNTQEQQKSNTSNTEQESKTTEIQNPDVLVLEKLPINNNDLTLNMNDLTVKEKKVKPTSTVAMRLINAVGCGITVKTENESENNDVPIVNDVAPVNNKPAATVNNVAPINNKSAVTVSNIVPINNKSAATVNVVAKIMDKFVPATKNIAPITNNCDPTTSDPCDTDMNLICKKTENVKIIEDSIMAIDCKDQSDTDSVTYIIPVESEITVENMPETNINDTTQYDKDIVTIENNTDLKENCNDKTKSISVSKSDFNDEDDDCEIIFDDTTSSIVINSDDDDDDEDILLISVEEIDINELTNNLINKKGKDTCKNVAEEQYTSVKATRDDYTSKTMIKAKRTNKNVPRDVENKANGAENESEKCYDSDDTISVKPGLIQERKRPSLDYPKTLPKKCKLLTDYKKVLILPKDYPQTEMDSKKAREIQSAILKSIDYTQESIPFLKCQGIQNGGLIYSCQDEKSLFFLENIMQKMEDLNIVYEFDSDDQIPHKIAFRINSYLDEPVYKVFNRLELYNSGLICEKWVIVKREQYGDFIVIYAEVDEISFNYICEANFVLYVGNDCARFTIVWN